MNNQLQGGIKRCARPVQDLSARKAPFNRDAQLLRYVFGELIRRPWIAAMFDCFIMQAFRVLSSEF